MDFTPLERAIIQWFAENSDDLALRTKLASATPSARKYTGHGYFVDLARTEGQRVNDGDPVPGPHIVSSALPHGAGTVLFLAEGHPDMLEIFTYGNGFPQALPDFRLTTSSEASSSE